MMATMIESGRRMVRVDSRAAAAFRIGLGLCVAATVAVRMVLAEEMLTDDGVVRAATVMEAGPVFSLLLMSNIQGVILAVLAVAFAAGIGIAVGGKWLFPSAVVSWIILASIDARNEFVHNGGDRYLGLLVMWTALASPQLAETSVRGRGFILAPSLPLGCLLGQMVLMYVKCGLAKAKYASEWYSGDALRAALRNAWFASETGTDVVDNLPLVPLVAAGVMWSEILVPLLAFWPFARGSELARASFASWALAMHGSFVFCMRLGMFPWICMAPALLAVPSRVLDALTGASRRPRRLGWPAAPPQPTPGRVRTVLAGVAMAWILLFCAGFISNSPSASRPMAVMASLGRDLKLEQYWAMFSLVPKNSLWLHGALTLSDGRVVDPIRWLATGNDEPWLAADAMVVRAAPPRLADYSADARLLLSDRWTRYWVTLPGKPWIHADAARYVWRAWRRGHPDGPLSPVRFVLRGAVIPYTIDVGAGAAVVDLSLSTIYDHDYAQLC
ncbi:HTTM domain-containing protein [Thecamonas trahens ATCC 50062]|uniref:HTTM domain-containing protein n=1 Tax=Thecamonas trahens ATCC 50062 TaxID=461836 RepID=A0A0L0DC66_THETB|nr:HTTM domain-containing protein [Thecamonas trahens ATCC 50062]KNC49939.1 HTTM domain-containing protein [Thecamonas trahens ATCC 50062]|eukprot:XP_013757416.1 HTTM domain-containing protein [Thecamonas trahens ATCC 50062]